MGQVSDMNENVYLIKSQVVAKPSHNEMRQKDLIKTFVNKFCKNKLWAICKE